MALSAFADKSKQPTEEELRSVLGSAHPAWSQLIAEASEHLPSPNELWGFTSRSTGWGLRLRDGERVILYMTPCAGSFLVSFALGEKAVGRARTEKLPKRLLDAIEAAPRYAEGRGLRLEVRDSKMIPALAALARIKHESSR